MTEKVMKEDGQDGNCYEKVRNCKGERKMKNIIYDVLLKQQHYKPIEGHVGESKHICVFYDESKNTALNAMQKYVKKNGFVTPDKQFSVADVVLRERKSTGEVISITSYCKLFNTVTGELIDG